MWQNDSNCWNQVVILTWYYSKFSVCLNIFITKNWKKNARFDSPKDFSHMLLENQIKWSKTQKVMVWPDGHREDQEGLGDFSWFFPEPAIKTASPPSGACSLCSDESFVMPQLNFFPAVGRGSSSARDSRRQQKCVVSKCTWHFSSTTQLLSELATCALERKGKWGAPKVLSLEFANTPRDRENQSLMSYKKIKEELTHFFPFPVMSWWGMRALVIAPSILSGTG